MPVMVQLVRAEALKLRRSPALRLIWVLPTLFILLDFILTGFLALRVQHVTPEIRHALESSPLKSLANYWSGYFHPLLLALMPALIMRSEHRFGLWKHLHVQPVPRRTLYLVKSLVLALAFGSALGLAEVLLWAEWAILGRLHPLVHFAFPWFKVAKLLAWSFLGSLPLLSLYLWLSDRINSGAVSIMFALVGLILTLSLGGNELDPMWRRDFIPWVLPYTCAQQSIDDVGARQEIPAAQLSYNKPLKLERPKDITMGKQRIVIDFPDDFGKPLPPTPAWMLAIFSLGSSIVFLGLGILEAGRNRDA